MLKRETTIKLEPLIKTRKDSQDFQKKIFSKIFMLPMGLEVEEVEVGHNIWTFKTYFRTCLEALLRIKDKAQRRKLIKDRIWL